MGGWVRGRELPFESEDLMRSRACAGIYEAMHARTRACRSSREHARNLTCSACVHARLRGFRPADLLRVLADESDQLRPLQGCKPFRLRASKVCVKEVCVSGPCLIFTWRFHVVFWLMACSLSLHRNGVLACCVSLRVCQGASPLKMHACIRKRNGIFYHPPAGGR